MKEASTLTHEFVEFIPEDLTDGVIFVSIPYATVAHKCCCGCGSEVVTPLSPTDWRLIFDGRTISLDPSIGNWGFPCRSHYWIRATGSNGLPGGHLKWSKLEGFKTGLRRSSISARLVPRLPARLRAAKGRWKAAGQNWGPGRSLRSGGKTFRPPQREGFLKLARYSIPV